MKNTAPCTCARRVRDGASAAKIEKTKPRYSLRERHILQFSDVRLLVRDDNTRFYCLEILIFSSDGRIVL